MRETFSTRGTDAVSSDPGVSLAQASSSLFDYTSILSLVFGGCCSNVWLYENLLLLNPRIGSALTFSQMMFISLQSLPSFVTYSPEAWIPRLKPRQVPLRNWATQVLVLSTGSLLNNWAFAFNVPLTVLMVFRSAGLPVSMLFGFFFLKRRYSLVQVFSVIMVSFGVTIATFSRPPSNAPSQSNSDVQKYSVGIVMLVLSLLCTGFLGMLQEKTYQRYGPCWKEGVFYTHCLSLPIFLFLVQDVKQGLASLSEPSEASAAGMAWLILAGNLVTQLICVSGVNRLTSRVSSVSTNLVLTTRKAISLCFSVWWFGNGWNLQLGVGASMVFLGSILYSAGVRVEKKKIE
ncbi:UAA transporter [Armillaria novae-zelandiae]|uniref:UAA transporter n=1 Tax=Armillaria novae-zelandiae TaxID=153914 RepID=A0AA39PN30_9AGAR|nr:UAA transporter [Armillaria novae-zelandiae]